MIFRRVHKGNTSAMGFLNVSVALDR